MKRFFSGRALFSQARPLFSPARPPRRILVVTLRYVGDALLTTPLIRSLKLAYPAARVDVLTGVGNAGVFAGNADVGRVIPLTSKRILNFAGLLVRLFRRYDLAISTQAGDRPLLCAVASGKISLGFVESGSPRWSWRRLALRRALDFSARQEHAVLENLRFCASLGVPPNYRVTPPFSADYTPPDEAFAVLHIKPQWRYKEWRASGWLATAAFLHAQGLRVVLTGGPKTEEMAAVGALERQLPFPVLNLSGRLSLAELGALLRAARLFIGPDTGVTHMAAAAGTPVVALFGPTDPRIWGPWPAEFALDRAPFVSVGDQRAGNVWLVQGVTGNGCMPCQREGCGGTQVSVSECLLDLPAEKIIAAARALLESGAALRNPGKLGQEVG